MSTATEWSRATCINPSEAAKIKLNLQLENVGTCEAQEIQVTLNLQIGDRIIKTLTHPEPPGTISSIGAGGSYPWVSDFITLTLDELRALRTGALVRIEVTDISANVVRKDIDGYHSLGQWEDYFDDAEAVSAHLFMDLGNGQTTEHLVYAGSRENPWEPKVTLRDALIWAANGKVGEQGPEVTFYQPDGSLGESSSLANWYFSLDLSTYRDIESYITEPDFNFFDTVLTPGTVIVAKAPPINPTPKIRWAVLSPADGKVTAYVEDYFFSQTSLIVRFFDKYGNSQLMTWDADKRYFWCACPTYYVKDGTELIVARNPIYNPSDPISKNYRTVMKASEMAVMPSPKIVGSCNLLDWGYEIYVKDNYAYVASGNAGLQLVDISVPENPRVIGQCDTPGVAQAVFVQGSYAYVADFGYGGGLQVIDISVPTNPTLKGTCNVPVQAKGVFVQGNFAYVADYDAGLRVIDVSVPTSPTLKGTCDTPWGASAVYVQGNYAYVADSGAGLEVIDISNPESPTRILNDVGGMGMGVFVKDNYAYVADWYAGLQVIDISVPTSPTLTGTCGTPGGSHGVFVYGSYAYVADSDAGLQVIDISNPVTPKIAYTCDTPGEAYRSVRVGDYIYEADWWGGFNVIAFR
jgi:hypothetical protein